jgi:hypothetical protein
MFHIYLIISFTAPSALLLVYRFHRSNKARPIVNVRLTSRDRAINGKRCRRELNPGFVVACRVPDTWDEVLWGGQGVFKAATVEQGGGCGKERRRMSWIAWEPAVRGAGVDSRRSYSPKEEAEGTTDSPASGGIRHRSPRETPLPMRYCALEALAPDGA